MANKVSCTELFKVYNWGDSTLLQRSDLGKRRGVQVQDFQALKQQHTSAGTNFIDPCFPANNSSVGDINDLFDRAKDPAFYNNLVQGGWDQRIQWKRIKDFMKNGSTVENNYIKEFNGSEVPVFAIGNWNESFSITDITQGMVGDCWFLAALGAVSVKPEILDKCIPADNKYNEAGIYHFQFWYQGSWVDVVVDDYIPCLEMTKYDWQGPKTYFRPLLATPGKTGNQVEFWVMLAEKAYAKLQGDICTISGNSPTQGFENLTGGFPEIFRLGSAAPPDLLATIKKNLNANILMALTCVTSGSGLIGGHAYSITGYAQIQTTSRSFPSGTVDLVRIRNPHGRGEWTGSFGDDSPEWKYVTRAGEAANRVVADDGEFWIPYDQMLARFTKINVITLLDENVFGIPNSKLEYYGFFGSWSNADNTTGAWTIPDQTPQYVATVTGGDKCVLGITVTSQGNIKNDAQRNSPAFHVFKIPAGVTKDPPFNYDDMMIQNPYTKPPKISLYSQRVVDMYGKGGNPTARLFNCQAFLVPAGRYLITPILSNTGDEGKFCLRVLAQST